MEDTNVKEKRDVVQVESVDAADAEAHSLEEMGYKQELNRNLGMVAILGLSFAIMVRVLCFQFSLTPQAVPFGTSTAFPIALTNGGPVTILYGVRLRPDLLPPPSSTQLTPAVDLRVVHVAVHRVESRRNVSTRAELPLTTAAAPCSRRPAACTTGRRCCRRPSTLRWRRT